MDASRLTSPVCVAFDVRVAAQPLSEVDVVIGPSSNTYIFCWVSFAVSWIASPPL
jgi:hypothetical protein